VWATCANVEVPWRPFKIPGKCFWCDERDDKRKEKRERWGWGQIISVTALTGEKSKSVSFDTWCSIYSFGG